MKRRELITLVGGAAVAWPLVARAQQAGAVPLIGVLMDYAASDQAAQSPVTAFRDTLAKLGWKEGSNLRIEIRWSAGSADKVQTFAKELVDLRPDAILGRGTRSLWLYPMRRRLFRSYLRPYPIRSAVALPPT
jgi:putative ABC transport system substrate-binding protein